MLKLAITLELEEAVKQFIEKYVGERKFIVAVDHRRNMRNEIPGGDYSPDDFAIELARQTADNLKKPFKGMYCPLHPIGLSYMMVQQTIEEGENASEDILMNFCSFAVAQSHELANMKKIGYTENDFPEGLIIVSGGSFAREIPERIMRDMDTFQSILLSGGFSQDYVDNFKVILYDVFNDCSEAEAMMHISNYPEAFEEGNMRYLHSRALCEAGVLA